MSVLTSGILLFAAAFSLHLAVWRRRYPANPVKTLVLLFAAALFSGLILLSFFVTYTIAEYLHVSLLFFSLFISYLITYSAIEADSPSLTIVLRVAACGKEGMPCERLKEMPGDGLFIEPRLQDLVDAGMVDLSASIYRINKKGRLFLLPFLFFRNFLGLGKGG